MILCFDAGNSRLKWGIADSTGWQAQGALEWSRLDELSAQAANWPPQIRSYLASVASPEAEAALARALPADLPLARVPVTAAAGGVINGYDKPESLGVDRWCALIGARTLESRACLVVMAGTATTIDSLDADGRFLGGMILPGLGMMHHALFRGTARLPALSLDANAYAEFPRETQSAIISGCLEAQAGAITRAFHRLPDAACCLLSGGAAAFLLPLLDFPARTAPYLVLEGMRQLAQERAGYRGAD
jgi:type III pantothenate kinase